MNLIHKFLSLLLIVFFLIVVVIPQGVTFADVVDVFKNTKNEDINIIKNIPRQYGSILENNIKQEKKPNIILIYDMHCQSYTQNKIYSILKYIDSYFNVDKIFVEGAPEKQINMSSIKSIDKNTRIKILDNMLSKGLLSGTEKFLYLSNKDNFYGIENFDLYLTTVHQYVNCIADINYNLFYIDKEIKKLKQIKKNLYTDNMNFFEKLFFEDIKYDYKTLVKINGFLKNNNINLLSKYPNIYKYLKIKEIELKGTNNYYSDLQNLINICKNKLSFNRYLNLINNIKNKDIENQLCQTYINIKSFLSTKDILKYRYIEKIQEKNLMISTFSTKYFLQEKKDLYSNLSKQIFNTEPLSQIIFETKTLHTLKQYVQLKISYDEFNELEFNLQKIKNSSFISNNKNLLDILDNENIHNYYKNNILRNNIFTENILKNTNKDTTNIVVVGGFHIGIEKLLDENNIKYLSIIPNSIKANYSIYDKIMVDISLMNNCLADTPLILGTSQYKLEQFLISWIKELQNQGFEDSKIITIINSWAKEYKEFFSSNNDEKEIDVTDTVLKNNKFSLKGWKLKTINFLKDSLNKIKTIFKYKYHGDNPNNLDSKNIKNMENNIKYFPFIQFMLGFDLYGSFSTIFMQSNGYQLPFISLIFSLLSPISFAISGVGSVIGDKFSKRNLIIISIILHALGTITFALSGISSALLIASQVLSTIGISMLSLTLSPFLYKSLDNLGKKNDFKEIYGSNLSLFWIIMSISSLIGGALASITSQLTVIIIAAVPDIIIAIGALLFTHNENINEDKKEEKNVNTQKKNIKDFVYNLFAPIKQLSSNKNTFALAILNIVVNNIFFVVLCFFLQPTLITTGLNIALLAPVYFIGNLMQSMASNLINKVSFIVENKNIRTTIFAISGILFTLFVVTSHPLFLIIIYTLMNFWQGTSSLTEISAVYKTLDDNMRTKWLSFKSMFGMIISTVTQVSISGLLAIGLSNNIIIAGAVGIITMASIIIPKIINRNHNTITDFIKDIEINTNQIETLLSAA